jgi:hypothetical protein
MPDQFAAATQRRGWLRERHEKNQHVVMLAIWFRHLDLNVYSLALETAMRAAGINTLHFLVIHAATDFGLPALARRQARESSI